MEDDLKELLRKLMDSTRGTYGWTPLHTAVGDGDKRWVELLLKYGAKLKCKSWNQTPLEQMDRWRPLVREGGLHAQIIRMLEEAEAKLKLNQVEKKC